MKSKFTTLFVLLVIAVLASACGGSAPQGEAVSALTQEEATEMISSALQAFNTGDYATWSHDWDDAMKTAIPDSDFQEYRSQVVATYGQYVSLESVEIQPGMNEGFVRWVAIAVFENGKIKFNFGFANEGRQIKGIIPEEVK